ncbi:MAG: GNAT family N-acetyltransferase [Anaerolineaceae bacterium]|nr:GNAT family N-acetyltransferase [Anaerolineaceae bacterium]
MENIIHEWNDYQFRSYIDETDFQKMYAVFNRIRVHDDYGWCYESLKEFVNDWSDIPNFDIHRQTILIEHDGQVIGYGLTCWSVEDGCHNAFRINFNVVPEYRSNELYEIFYSLLEQTILDRRNEAPPENDNFIRIFLYEVQTDKIQFLESKGFRPARYGYTMRRSIDKPLEDTPLPEGIVVRGATEDEYQKVFKAVDEAFQDHWAHTPMTDEEIDRWMKSETFQPHLWKIAWDGDEVAGNVLNFILEGENKEYQRKRGYTEAISVRRPWRNQGIARALLNQSILMLRELGMEETALGVDAQNPNGALKLYESVGYEVEQVHIYLQKGI